jgi:Tfp pilus assembly protein PilE
VQGKYNIQITADTTTGVPPNYTITATPVAGTNQAQDGVLTLTHTGVKTRAGNVGW